MQRQVGIVLHQPGAGVERPPQELDALRLRHQDAGRVRVIRNGVDEFRLAQGGVEIPAREIPGQLLVARLPRPPRIEGAEVCRELRQDEIAGLDQHLADEIEPLHRAGRQQDVLDREAVSGRRGHARGDRRAERREALDGSVFEGGAAPARERPVGCLPDGVDGIELGRREAAREADDLRPAAQGHELLGHIVAGTGPAGAGEQLPCIQFHRAHGKSPPPEFHRWAALSFREMATLSSRHGERGLGRVRGRTDVAGGGTDQAAGLLLLQRMGDPAGDAAHGEDGDERVPRQAQRVQQERRIELHVGVEGTAGLQALEGGDRVLLHLLGGEGLFTAEGELVVSVMQEGLIRISDQPRA